MIYLALFLGVLLGLAVLLTAATRPKHVWALVVVLAILTSSVRVQGYSFFDELAVALVLLGVLMSMAVGHVIRARPQQDQPAKFHVFFFLLMVSYMFLQSLRGWAEFGFDAQKLRWVAFFGLLGLIALILYTRRSIAPSGIRAARPVAIATGAYLGLYLLHGVTAELLRGLSRYEVQSTEWSPPSYAALPIAVGIPAAILCIKLDRSRQGRVAGWASIILAFVAGFYYDARAGLISVTALLVVAAPTLGWKRLLHSFLAVVVVVVAFVPVKIQQEGSFRTYMSGVVSAGEAFWTGGQTAWGGEPVARDVDRWIHAKAAVGSISEGWTTALFGHGYRTYGPIINKEIYPLYQEYMPWKARDIANYESTIGFSALLIDTGLVGLTLLVFNFALTLWQIVRREHSRFRYGLVASGLLLLLWLITGNILDMVLFYLAIMPSGILVQMAGAETREATAAQAAPTEAYVYGRGS
jgi:hypothetical protein